MEKLYHINSWQHLLSIILPMIKDKNRICISISKKNDQEMVVRMKDENQTNLPRIQLVKGYDLFW